MPTRQFPPEEVAFHKVIQRNPNDTTAKLIYADWLEEHDRSEQAGFLRFAVTVPNVLVDSETEAEQERLMRELERRARLRQMRSTLPSAWLKAISDTGLVGEIVVYVTSFYGNRAHFGVISKETANTVLVATLGVRRVGGDIQEPHLRPLLPTEAQLAQIVSARVGLRARKGDKVFSNSRRFRWFHFWDGKTVYECTD